MFNLLILFQYFDDITTVFGHIPTMNYGEEYRNKVIKTKTWIAIDMGAGDGTTEQSFYALMIWQNLETE